MNKDFISLKDLTPEEILKLLNVSARLKKNRLKSNVLQGKTIGLIFQKPSNRTRVSFEVGVTQLGGSCIYLGPEEINLGVRETTSDIAQTLSRYLHGIVARTFSHQDVVDLAKYATIPVINGLSDLFHPCQALADIFSIQEKFGKLKGLKLAYVGDGNNVCHSLMVACSKVGLHMKIATPKGYEPMREIQTLTQLFAKKSGSKISVTASAQAAVQNADIIYSDTWVSMGQEEETKKRLNDFKGFQINADLVKNASKDYIFMHCLPAHRGQEVTEQIIDGKHSIIFDQAENRLHTQKAILMFLFEKK